MLQWCSYLPVAFAEKAMATESLDVEDPALKDGGASFGNGDGGSAAAVVVTDATIGVLGEEHFAIVVGIGYGRVGWSTGSGVAHK